MSSHQPSLRPCTCSVLVGGLRHVDAASAIQLARSYTNLFFAQSHMPIPDTLTV